MLAQNASQDPKQRKADFDKVQQIVADQAPMLFLVNPNALSAVSPNVKNVTPAVLRPQIYWNAERLQVGGTAGEPAMTSLLQARLSVDYPNKPGVLRDVEIEIGEGEILGLVGESGSGKSTIALALLRLLRTQGRVHRGRNSFRRPGSVAAARRAKCGRFVGARSRWCCKARWRPLTRRCASARKWRRLGARTIRRRGKAWKPRALEFFDLVSLPAEESFLDRYPRQFSVGQAQRVLIAMAVLHKPRLLIADEPTSALDAITQSEILDLFRSLNRELNMAMLFVSHDLLAVASLCSRIAILQRGQIVESGLPNKCFAIRAPKTRARCSRPCCAIPAPRRSFTLQQAPSR